MADNPTSPVSNAHKRKAPEGDDAPSSPAPAKLVKISSSEKSGVSPTKSEASSNGSPKDASISSESALPARPSDVKCTKCHKTAILRQSLNGQPQNYGRWYAKCPNCPKFWEWVTPALSSSASTASAKPQTSPTVSPSSSPSKSTGGGPPKVLTCHCKKPAYMFKARNGKPENIGRWFGKCESCKFFGAADEPQPPVALICDCGKRARMCQAKRGMPHNIGMWFGICATKECDYWRWSDGSKPFGEAAVERFGDWLCPEC
ncbi:hypothetical protein BOTBODRAFT_25637 [Botryobasidium botryosum FD-172 SS1]|uniref:Uncharacterized protein n=1 Tax=Botryobasidium botryosum (strain FD-172 SS1) TaxID=930990 RepID=A0A067MZP2_BOTB1|nr:hypothetical protein BOTBODRAFT_25637 [Botryobasidium botryosum FD-172 SS1]